MKKVHMGKAGCGLDLGDGSERGEYVNQDYILERLGRPHRNIGLMYTYYPYDRQWPQRISEACRDMEIHFQWDYPYDDYFPYTGGTGVPGDEPVFQQMRDIRRHGQDVTLTLTADCRCDDEKLEKIALELRHFGRMKLRINHECAGDWFTHNQRYSFREIADFFVRFHKIIKENAPNVTTIFDTGFVRPDGTLENEKDFAEAYRIADEWSADCYLALHYGWPFDVAEKESKTYSVRPSVEEFVRLIDKTYSRYRELFGDSMRPLVISEFNTDGDVTGGRAQGNSVIEFARQIKEGNTHELSAFTMYQFRDRGRLGLEIEDPNNKDVGISQPLMEEYKKILQDDYFRPSMTTQGDVSFPARLRWGSSEDSDGLQKDISFKDLPVFCEVTFSDEDQVLNVMMEINGKWFYKKPGVKTVDLMPAFYHEDPETFIPSGSHERVIPFRMFTPPATGENTDINSEAGIMNSYTDVVSEPSFRIRYAPLAVIGK